MCVFFYAIKKVFSPLCVRVSNRLVTQLYYTTHFSYACSLSYIFLIHSLESVCSVISFCFFCLGCQLFLIHIRRCQGVHFGWLVSVVPRWPHLHLNYPAFLRNQFYRLSTRTVLFGLWKRGISEKYWRQCLLLGWSVKLHCQINWNFTKTDLTPMDKTTTKKLIWWRNIVLIEHASYFLKYTQHFPTSFPLNSQANFYFVHSVTQTRFCITEPLIA